MGCKQIRQSTANGAGPYSLVRCNVEVWKDGFCRHHHPDCAHGTKKGLECDKCTIATLRADLDRAREENAGWQPMNTAPRDGTIILAFRFYHVAMYWSGRDDEFPWEAVQIGASIGGLLPFMENGFSENDPSIKGWMPLPTPPQEGL